MVPAVTAGLLLSETFGPTLQGEGPRLGRRSSFIRLGACNLACSWCDSGFTWDRTRYDLTKELTTRPADEVLEEVLAHDTDLIVITGGEPLLQQHRSGWTVLVDGLLSHGREVDVETNGTVTPVHPGIRYVVSPKLAHSDDPEGIRLIPAALTAFASLAHARMADFKFVAETAGDLEEVRALVDRYTVPRSRVWVMTEGVSSGAILEGTKALAEDVLAQGWNLTTRLHTLLWGDERGR